MANYSFKQPPANDGDTIRRFNCAQLFADTMIFDGVTGLTLIDCNLKNCLPPEDAILIGCEPMNIDFCAHEHPEWDLPYEGTEDETCRHVVKEVLLDGELVYLREDTILNEEDE